MLDFVKRNRAISRFGLNLDIYPLRRMLIVRKIRITLFKKALSEMWFSYSLGISKQTHATENIYTLSFFSRVQKKNGGRRASRRCGTIQ